MLHFTNAFYSDHNNGHENNSTKLLLSSMHDFSATETDVVRWTVIYLFCKKEKNYQRVLNLMSMYPFMWDKLVRQLVLILYAYLLAGGGYWVRISRLAEVLRLLC